MPVPQSLLCLAQQAPADLLGQPLPLLLTLLDQLGQQLQEEQRQRGQARPPSALPPAACLPLTYGLTLGSSSASCWRICCCPATRRSCRCFWASSSCACVGGKGSHKGL